MVLVIGPNGSGKSAAAERLACDLHAAGQGDLVYLATMVPDGSDGQTRVAKHRLQRAGRGFTTVESPLGVVNPADVILLEDASNLLANYMFAQHDPAPLPATLAQIDRLQKSCRHLVVVSIGGLECQPEYDDGTRAYIDALGQANAALRANADQVIETSGGRA